MKIIIKRNIIFSFSVSILIILSTAALADDFKKLFEKGQQGYERGQYDEAVKFLNEALELDPNSKAVYNALGLVYKAKGTELAEVVWYFKVALDIDPEYQEAILNMARLYYDRGKFDLAEKYFLRSLKINPDQMNIEYSLAWLYLYGKSEPSESIYYFKRVLERVPIPQAYYGLGIAYSENGDNAMVLDMVTTLKKLGEKEYATKLENHIRQKEEEGKKQTAAQQPQAPQPSQAVNPNQFTGAPSGVGRVRLRGTLYNINDSNSQPQQPNPAGQKTDILRSGN